MPAIEASQPATLRHASTAPGLDEATDLRDPSPRQPRRPTLVRSHSLSFSLTRPETPAAQPRSRRGLGARLGGWLGRSRRPPLPEHTSALAQRIADLLADPAFREACAAHVDWDVFRFLVELRGLHASHPLADEAGLARCRTIDERFLGPEGVMGAGELNVSSPVRRKVSHLLRQADCEAAPTPCLEVFRPVVEEMLQTIEHGDRPKRLAGAPPPRPGSVRLGGSMSFELA